MTKFVYRIFNVIGSPDRLSQHEIFNPIFLSLHQSSYFYLIFLVFYLNSFYSFFAISSFCIHPVFLHSFYLFHHSSSSSSIIFFFNFNFNFNFLFISILFSVFLYFLMISFSVFFVFFVSFVFSIFLFFCFFLL